MRRISAIFLSASLAGIGLSRAQDAAVESPAPAIVAPAPAAYEDFTFKRLKAPPKGARPVIDVQIDPEEQARVLARRPSPREAERLPPEAGPMPPSGPPSGYEWYWAMVSPRLDDMGPARVTAAIEALRQAPDGQSPGPRLQFLQSIAEAYGSEILRATIGTRVSPALVLAVIATESGGRADAVSSAGATGLMQLMPDTAARFGVKNSKNPVENIKGGVAYLDWLLGEFGGDAVLALAGYNAGEGSVRNNNGVPPFAETRAYVPKVLTAWTVARGLCMTTPELISDPCVLGVRRTVSN